ncbi:MAG TPA: response regulator [Polyangiaceae bacterium]|nr:response regulator [Polyangiaceae bacterium]
MTDDDKTRDELLAELRGLRRLVAGAPAGRPPPDDARGAVWLVEDSPTQAAAARRALSAEHEVDVFSESASLLERLAAGPAPDVLVLDWRLPEMSGVEVVRFLRREYDETVLPVLMLTAQADKASLAEALAAGANDFLPKPFDPLELRARARTLLRLKRSHARALWLAAAQHEHLQRLLAQAPAQVATLRGPDHVFEFVNPLYRQVVGRDVVGRPVREALPELAGQGVFERLDRVYATGERFVGTEVLARVDRRGDGALDEGYFNVVYEPMLDARGRPEGVLSFGVEVTDQVLARRRVEASERAYRELADSLPLMVWVDRPDSTVEYLNARWRELTGQPGLQMDWRAALHPEDAEAALATWAAAAARGEPFEAQYRLRARDGTYRWFLGRSVPVRDAAGEVSKWIGSATDIHDQKQAERRAEDANRAKDQFLSVASHELRTPLNAILGWASMLRAGSLDAPTRERAIAAIDRNARAQAQLVDDILDVSRIISGKLRLDLAPIDPARVVEAALDVVRPAAAAKGVRLEARLGPDAGTLSGDAARLQQIVWNLLSNAVKFTPEGGRVDVRLRRDDAHVELAVADTGEGIDPAFLPHVFEHFRQADSSATRPHGGLGLGLAIVKHLVELHGGRVEARSEGPGRGSAFAVRIPLAPPRPPSIAPPPPAVAAAARRDEARLSCPPGLDALRVLVVDDDRDAREALRSVLEPCGVEVTTAASAAEALARFRERPPDVLVSNVGLPRDDGYALIRQVRALPPAAGGRTPAVALTAYARSEERMRALVEGFSNHLPKPVEPQELLAVLASLARFSRPSP